MQIDRLPCIKIIKYNTIDILFLLGKHILQCWDKKLLKILKTCCSHICHFNIVYKELIKFKVYVLTTYLNWSFYSVDKVSYTNWHLIDFADLIIYVA